MFDFMREAVELGHCFCASGVGDPIQFLEPVEKCRFDVLNEFVHTGFGLRRKIFLHVKLAERLANVLIDAPGRALPTWLLILPSAQYFAKESEVFILEVVAQKRRARVNRMPSQVSFPF